MISACLRRHSDRLRASFAGYLPKVFAVAVLGSLAVAVTASAETTISVDFFDAGFFTEGGRSSKEDAHTSPASPITPPGAFANHHVGLTTGYGGGPTFPDEVAKNFFVFDMSEYLTALGGPPPGPITAATLKVYMPSVAANGFDGYLSPSPSETYVISGVGSKSAAEVMDHYDIAGSGGYYEGSDETSDALMVFDELASGPTFGTAVVSAADNGEYVEIAVTPIGVGYLNFKLTEFLESSGEMFVAFGGTLTTLDGDSYGDDDPFEEIFAYTHPNGVGSPDTSATPPKLELTFAPEPGGLLLAAAGLWAIFGRRRRFR